MIKLPSIENKVIKRPGHTNGLTKHYIPDTDNAFWDDFYRLFNNNFKLSDPIHRFSDKINPYFGYFGNRWHPINFQPAYFHIGVDVTEAPGSSINAVYKGNLEYSGYANVNGNYVIVKHPEVSTLDGYVFQSLYMHCDDLQVRFNTFQKVLREYVSKKLLLANTFISHNQQIATVGITGNKLGVVPHLHLQFEFVKNNTHIAVNPLKLYNRETHENLTAAIATQEEFRQFYHQNANELVLWKKFWSNKV